MACSIFDFHLPFAARAAAFGSREGVCVPFTQSSPAAFARWIIFVASSWPDATACTVIGLPTVTEVMALRNASSVAMRSAAAL
jgi:hypothetical protein